MNFPFDDLLIDVVLAPWQNACAAAEFPWQATPALRARWLGLIEDRDQDVALAGALGLARCAGLTARECAGVFDFFSRANEFPLPPVSLAAYLVTGASPSTLIWDLYCRPLLAARQPPPTTVWHLVMAMLRHPCAGGFSHLIASDPDVGGLPHVSYGAACNPLMEDKSVAGEQKGVWWEALNVFHPLQPRLAPAQMPAHPLLRFAYFLRVDFTSAEYQEASALLPLEDPFFFCHSFHPCLTQGRAPNFDPRNPCRAALEFFGVEAPVAELWRFYNPLLIHPWLMESVGSQQDPGPYLGLLLLGAPAVEASRYRLYDQPGWRSLIELHPSHNLQFRRKVSGGHDSTNSTRSQDGSLANHR